MFIRALAYVGSVTGERKKHIGLEIFAWVQLQGDRRDDRAVRGSVRVSAYRALKKLKIKNMKNNKTIMTSLAPNIKTKFSKRRDSFKNFITDLDFRRLFLSG